ncbi:MAG: hypothetical protein QNK05_07680 [Myxococcota bacterium]|nr:hypothetical protein [Myxococcota bacterium]
MSHRRARSLAAGLLTALLLQTACTVPGWVPFIGEEPVTGPAPDPSYGIQVTEDAAVIEFFERASYFYDRFQLRRVNTLSTYRDEVLRDFFRTDAAFADYYADFAYSLNESYFERNRPLALEVVEMKLMGPGVAEVITRIVGDNGLPLRWWSTSMERVDRWERMQGRWWIVPRKL